MRIDAKENVRDVVAGLDDLARSQVPFALSKALNQTARDFQKEERESIEEHFSLRRKAWARQNVKIRPEDNATKKKLEAVVRLEAPGDPGRSDILGKFEEGGQKHARSGGQLAVPVISVKASPAKQRPRSYEFESVSGMMWKGNRRTFMLLGGGGGNQGIYQRVGRIGRKRKDGVRGKGAGRRMVSEIHGRTTRDMNIRLLFKFKGAVPVDKRLKWGELSGKVAKERMTGNFEQSLAHAIKTAR